MIKIASYRSSNSEIRLRIYIRLVKCEEAGVTARISHFTEEAYRSAFIVGGELAL